LPSKKKKFGAVNIALQQQRLSPLFRAGLFNI